MSSKPWYRWFSVDYKAKTSHLDFIHDSAYRRLLDAYYEHRGPLPAYLSALYRITGAQTPEECQAINDVVKEFFVNGEDVLKHQRCDEEIAEAQTFHQQMVQAGSKGGLSSAQARLKPRSTQSQSQLQPQPQPQPQPQLQTPVVCIVLRDGSEFPIFEDTVIRLDRTYPAVDAVGTLREIETWNISNPQKRKYKSGIMRHINGWFKDEQEKANAKAVNPRN